MVCLRAVCALHWRLPAAPPCESALSHQPQIVSAGTVRLLTCTICIGSVLVAEHAVTDVLLDIWCPPLVLLKIT